MSRKPREKKMKEKTSSPLARSLVSQALISAGKKNNEPGMVRVGNELKTDTS